MVTAEPGWELLAPVHFSTVCFRHVPPAAGGDEAALEQHNAGVLTDVNSSGEFLMSHTKLHGRYTLRLTLGAGPARVSSQKKDPVFICEGVAHDAGYSIHLADHEPGCGTKQ